MRTLILLFPDSPPYTTENGSFSSTYKTFSIGRRRQKGPVLLHVHVSYVVVETYVLGRFSTTEELILTLHGSH